MRTALLAPVAVALVLAAAGCGGFSGDRDVARAIEAQTGREVTSTACEEAVTGLLAGEQACGVVFGDGGCEAWLATRTGGVVAVEPSPSRVILLVDCS